MPGAADPPPLSPKPLRRDTRQPKQTPRQPGPALEWLDGAGTSPQAVAAKLAHTRTAAPLPCGKTERGCMTKRITGRRLQRIRKQVFGEQPICVACKAKGRVTVATQVDHIVALVNGGEDHADNRQALCDECHKAKTRRDLGQRERVTFDADGRVVW